MWRFLKKLQIELPYDPAIPLLGIHTRETRIERDMVGMQVNIPAQPVVGIIPADIQCHKGRDNNNKFFHKATLISSRSR